MAHAQSVVTLYDNDFENPVSINCTNAWSNNAFVSDYGTASVPIIQNKDVDRLCASTSPTGVSGYYYDSDPLNPAGQYVGAMSVDLSGINGWIEAWGMQFDPQGKDYLNLSLDWSLIDRIDGSHNALPPDQPTDVLVRFYRVPMGATLGLADADMLPPDVTVDGLTATPFEQSRFTIQPRNPYDPSRRFEFNWQKQALSVGLAGQGFQAGDKVAVVYHLDGTGVGRKYAAFDNYVVTASNSPTAPNVIGKSAAVPANALWALVLTALGILGFGWRGQRKRLRC